MLPVVRLGLASLALALPTLPAHAVDPEALAVINDSADRICGGIDKGGELSSVEIEGTIGAELKGLARRLADANIEGSAKFEDREYTNVLREQLGAELENTRACRLRVFEMLVDRLEARAPDLPDNRDDDWNQGGTVPQATELAGMVQWGPYINCEVTNLGDSPVMVKSINYLLQNAWGQQPVSYPCTFNCGLLGYQSNLFSGPPNAPTIATASCSVSVTW